MVVTMDTDMDTSLRDRFVRTRILNVERGGQTASTSFNIRDNKTNVEWLFKQSLNSFKLIQHRFNFAVQQNRRDFEANIEAICRPGVRAIN